VIHAGRPFIWRIRAVKKSFLLIVFFGLAGFVSDAYAYLDPGTGSYILQIILAGVAASLFVVKLFWAKIKMFVWTIFGKKKTDD
jgi:hypothetical protein